MTPAQDDCMIKHVVSVSGGKDSTATLQLALERCGYENVIAIFCDTGNEHQAVYEYLDYLEVALGMKIQRLKANFTEQIMAKRIFIARDQRGGRLYDTSPVFDAQGNPVPKRDSRGQVMMHWVKRQGQTLLEPIQKTRKVGSGHRVRWTNKAKRRALAVLHPTGNPFLDLCLWKGRFPSRKAQFCTEELKRNLAVEFQLRLIDEGHQVISWQGIRRDESLKRRNARKFERLGGGVWIFRPIVDWTAAQVFEYCQQWAINPNPLYLQGMDRVGCMPCINVNKGELKEISRRFPDHIAKVATWETLVSQACKRGYSTFMHKGPAEKTSFSPQATFASGNIEQVVHWAKTSRGGKQFDLLESLEPTSGCSSSYGLCDQPNKAAA